MAVEFKYNIKDTKGMKASTSVYAADGFTYAQYQEAIQKVWDRIRALIGGILGSAQICIDIDLSGVVQTGRPLAASDVEEVGEFIVSASDGTQSQINVPTLDELTVLANSDVLDDADANITAFKDAILTGVLLDDGVTTVVPVNIAGFDLDAIDSALERFRNSGPLR